MFDKDPKDMTPDEFQVAFDKQFGEALQFVMDLVKSDAEQGVVRSVDERTEHSLMLIDRFIQAMYYGNVKEGNFEEAVLGLMTGVRAAFLAGYRHKQDADFIKSMGPVSKKDLQ